MGAKCHSSVNILHKLYNLLAILYGTHSFTHWKMGSFIVSKGVPSSHYTLWHIHLLVVLYHVKEGIGANPGQVLLQLSSRVVHVSRDVTTRLWGVGKKRGQNSLSKPFPTSKVSTRTLLVT